MVEEKKEYSRNTLNQFKASKTRLPRRKNETWEEILKQDQWSHCLKKRKTLLNILTLYLKELEKQEQIKFKVSGSKEIIKIMQK